MLQRFPVILAVTASSYGLSLPADGGPKRAPARRPSGPRSAGSTQPALRR